MPTFQGSINAQATPPEEEEGRYTFSPGAWGGRGMDRDEQGNYIFGTDGATRDVNRFRDMAHGGPVAGPQIDQNLSNQSRGYETDAIGLLGATAQGKGDTPAVLLGRQNVQNAVQTQQSFANSARGGAFGRAAASRAANANRGLITNTGMLQERATRAGEMAGARGALMRATTDQRGQDLGVAADQARLDQGQRERSAQRELFYEGLGWQTKNAQMGANVGRSAAEQGSANANRAQDLNEGQADWDKFKDTASTVTGGVAGGVAAYEKTHSDERTKTNVIDLDEGVVDLDRPEFDQRAQSRDLWFHRDTPEDQARVKREHEDRAAKDAEDMKASMKKILEAGPSTGPKRRVKDRAKLLVDADLMMASMRANLDRGPSVRAQDESADRDLALSDDRTKLAQAWDEGHAAAVDNMQKLARMPAAQLRQRGEPIAQAVRGIKADAWDEGRTSTRSRAPAPAPKPMVPASEGERLLGRPVEDEDDEYEVQLRKELGPQFKDKKLLERAIARKKYEHTYGPGSADEIERWGAAHDAEQEATARNQRSADFARRHGLPVVRDITTFQRDPRPQPPVTADLAGSDKRIKKSDGEAPMAAANRSMEPSLYEYKPEFTPPAQRPGEKNVGPMAQNMAKDPLASTAVVRGPDGLLMIDKEKGLKLAMGGLASLQKQVDDLRRKESRR